MFRSAKASDLLIPNDEPASSVATNAAPAAPGSLTQISSYLARELHGGEAVTCETQLMKQGAAGQFKLV